MLNWKEKLAGSMPSDLAGEIDVYETQIELRRLGKVDEKLFAETRLRRGVYGQRYDNGQRHDGTRTQHLGYPSAALTKGPETMWDAPGMQRIKIPFGGLSPAQLELLADVAEEHADGILHVTTRQDFQLHFTHIDETPTLMRRLASVGITTREACGNAVRNVTACPLAGVCHTETFDVTPYAKALSRFLLGHPDTQDFGRKFKPAFSGCEQEACGLVHMHDLGAIARLVDGRRGFRLFVGGGLGTVPYQAKVFSEFVPEEELLPLAQAIGRVYARLGEKQNRARARIKFLVAKLGIDEFRRLVLEERALLPPDPRWTSYIGEAHAFHETPSKPPAPLDGAPRPAGFDAWAATNVHRQRQPGYAVAAITLPLGDLTSRQARRVADLARRYSGDSIRTTVEQNIVLRWVSEADLPALYGGLVVLGLGEPGAGTILDVTACPGTDTCKLGIASSRGLAREIRGRLAGRFFTLDTAARGLRLKMSGCFNSCGQHHTADIGFYGITRTVAGRKVPHFQVLLGGTWKDNIGAYGLSVGSIPAKNVPLFVDRITERFVRERRGQEGFADFVGRIGKQECRNMIEELMPVPAYETDPSYYSDWGDPREFTMGDLGTGECAGEVVSRLDFDLQAAERLCFEAQLKMEARDVAGADDLAYRAMLQAALALVKEKWYDVPNEPAVIAREFRARLLEPKIFWDRFAGGKFAQDFFRRHDGGPVSSGDEVRRLVEESQLFIEAAHACADRLRQEKAAGPPLP
jgi:ferredoxin-nitrite reductase